MDIKELERLKHTAQEEANKKPIEWFSILGGQESILKSTENGYTLYFKKELLQLLGFMTNEDKVTQLQRKIKELPIKVLLCGDKIIIKKGDKNAN